MTVRDFIVRHPDEAELVKRILANDPRAVNIFLTDLSSANSQRCKALQDAIHDIKDPSLWYHLLHYLALNCWGDHYFYDRSFDPIALERTDQAIVEVYIRDKDDQESTIKESVLLEALETPEENVYYAAAYLLGSRHDSRSIPILAEIIDKGNRKWKMRAIKALSTLKDEKCASPLIKVLIMDRGKLHREARRALQNLGPLAESVWLEALNHPDSHIRWEAAHGLGQIGDARAAPTLVEGLFDESYVVRWITANVLARLGEQGIPATLSVLCSHEISEPFRQAAYHALHGCTSPRIREHIKPLLDALSGLDSKEPVSSVAQRLLVEWKKVSSQYCGGRYGTGITDTMATYLFKCKICGEVFEKKLHFNYKKEEVTCPNGHHEVRRIYTPPAIVFKGQGFYINDSKSKSTIKE